MKPLNEKDLIYDWNLHQKTATRPDKPLEFDDETLRDGLQSPSAIDPPIGDKLELIHLMAELGIQGADISLPAAGKRAFDDADRIVQEIVSAKLPIFPNCAARTVVKDVEPIVELSQKHGVPIEVATFIGSSPIRQFSESWDLDFLLKCIEETVAFSVKNNLPVMFVTEDSIRAQPEELKRMYQTAIRAGAKRICCTDTVGHATPDGARALTKFLRGVADEIDPEVKLDWHGHEDRNLGVANTLAAAEAGADRIHGTALGIGERCGNTPMDILLVNCKLIGWIDQDLSALNRYVEKASQVIGAEIPHNYPVLGHDAFRTTTGVHASAIIKAKKKGDAWLADRVYSGVPASWVGREQLIEIGPMSGVSNVVFWLESRGFEAKNEWVDAIFSKAKQGERTLTDDEIKAVIQAI